MMPFENVLGRLQGVRPNGGNGFIALCPSHDDKSPSLSVTASDDKVLLYCHAGCDYNTILRSMNLTASDLFPPSNGGGHRASPKPLAVASKKNITESMGKMQPLARLSPNDFPKKLTRSEMGESLKRGVRLELIVNKIKQTIEKQNNDACFSLTVCRYSPTQVVIRFDFHDGGKTFRPIHADETGQWSLGDGMEPWPLYQQDKIPESGTVILCEGEKCVDALAELGILAVTSPHGANATKKADVKALVGRDVCILPDCDSVGKKYAFEMAAKLLVVGCRVKIVDLPGLDEAEDVADWLKTGGDVEQLSQLVEQTAWVKPGDLENAFLNQVFRSNLGLETNPIISPMSIADFLTQKLPQRNWLWEKMIPSGSLFLLSGYLKIGKSSWLGQFVTAISQGQEFLRLATVKTPTLLLAVEEHQRDIIRRFETLEARGDLSIQCSPLRNTPETIESLKYVIQEKGIGLVIIDTFNKFSTAIDENSNSQMLAQVTPLLDLARETDCAIGLVVHERKSGGNHGQGIRGASALFGAVDQSFTLERRHGGKETDRVLKTIGRYSESPAEMVLSFEDGRYQFAGTPQDVGKAGNENSILGFLSDAPQGVEAIAKGVGLTLQTARNVCGQLYKDGQIGRTGEGRKGNEFQYLLKGEDDE